MQGGSESFVIRPCWPHWIRDRVIPNEVGALRSAIYGGGATFAPSALLPPGFSARPGQGFASAGVVRR